LAGHSGRGIAVGERADVTLLLDLLEIVQLVTLYRASIILERFDVLRPPRLAPFGVVTLRVLAPRIKRHDLDVERGRARRRLATGGLRQRQLRNDQENQADSDDPAHRALTTLENRVAVQRFRSCSRSGSSHLLKTLRTTNGNRSKLLVSDHKPFVEE